MVIMAVSTDLGHFLYVRYVLCVMLSGLVTLRINLQIFKLYDEPIEEPYYVNGHMRPIYLDHRHLTTQSCIIDRVELLTCALRYA